MLLQYREDNKTALQELNGISGRMVKLEVLKDGRTVKQNLKPYPVRHDEKRIKRDMINTTTKYRNSIKQLLVLIADNSRIRKQKHKPNLSNNNSLVIDRTQLKRSIVVLHKPLCFGDWMTAHYTVLARRIKNRIRKKQYSIMTNSYNKSYAVITHNQYKRIVRKAQETERRINRLKKYGYPIKDIRPTENLKVLLRTMYRIKGFQNHNRVYNLTTVKRLYHAVYNRPISNDKIKAVLDSIGYERTATGYKRFIYSGDITALQEFNGTTEYNRKSKRLIAQAIKLKDNKPYFPYAIRPQITEAELKPTKEPNRFIESVRLTPVIFSGSDGVLLCGCSHIGETIKTEPLKLIELTETQAVNSGLFVRPICSYRQPDSKTVSYRTGEPETPKVSFPIVPSMKTAYSRFWNKQEAV